MGQFGIDAVQLLVLPLQLEDIALQVFVLPLLFFELLEEVIELIFEILSFGFEFGLRESQQFIGFNEVVYPFLLFLAQYFILLDLKAALLLFGPKVLQLVLQPLGHEQEETAFVADLVNLTNLLLAHSKLLQQVNHLNFYLKEDLLTLDLE